MSWLRLGDLWDGFLDFIDGTLTSLKDIHEEPLERETRAGFDSMANKTMSRYTIDERRHVIDNETGKDLGPAGKVNL